LIVHTQTTVVCAGPRLQKNDRDEGGKALLDEFLDVTSACIKGTFESDIQIESICIRNGKNMQNTNSLIELN